MKYPCKHKVSPSGREGGLGRGSWLVACGNKHSENYVCQAERYYKANSLSLFEITFPWPDEKAKKVRIFIPFTPAYHFFKMDWVMMSIVILCVLATALYSCINALEKHYQKRC